jgi:hypothetical protein
MTYNSTTPEEMALRLPITSQSIAFANRFSQQQPTPGKRSQVSLNTLAVCAINDYLQMMGFETNLAGGDSWNPIARMCADTADLAVTGIGKLECRPVNPGELEYSIPPEVWLDRVGYLFVEIEPAARAATILGFIPEARASVRLTQLRSLEDFIDHLHGLTIARPQSEREILSAWLESLEGAISRGWQTIESLTNPPEFAFRSEVNNTISLARRIDLGIQVQQYSVDLVVAITPEASMSRAQIRLQISPVNQVYLPPNLQLIVLDDADMVFLEAQSRAVDNLLQLQFSGNIGEIFKVNLRLGEAEISLKPFEI